MRESEEEERNEAEEASWADDHGQENRPRGPVKRTGPVDRAADHAVNDHWQGDELPPSVPQSESVAHSELEGESEVRAVKWSQAEAVKRPEADERRKGGGGAVPSAPSLPSHTASPPGGGWSEDGAALCIQLAVRGHVSRLVCHSFHTLALYSFCRLFCH